MSDGREPVSRSRTLSEIEADIRSRLPDGVTLARCELGHASYVMARFKNGAGREVQVETYDDPERLDWLVRAAILKLAQPDRRRW